MGHGNRRGPTGLATWRLMSIRLSIGDIQAMATTIQNQVQQLYVGLLGRAADQGGLNWWVDQVTTGGKTVEDIRASFVTSTEYLSLYPAEQSRADLVIQIYQNLFEREPSQGEVDYWAVTDTRPADELVAAFLQFASVNDQKTITNKVFVANAYTSTVDATNFSKAGAAAAIAGVDGTAKSLTEALTKLENGALPGQVPGLALINAKVAADAGVAAFETSNKAAADALVAKLKKAGGIETDALTDDAAFDEKVAAVVADAESAREDVSEKQTLILEAEARIANIAFENAKAALTPVQQQDAAAYNAAVAADAKAKEGAATAPEKAGVTAALAADTSAAAVAALAGTTAADVYKAYVEGTAAERTALDKKFADVGTYAAFKAAAVKDAAAYDAAAKLATATLKVVPAYKTAQDNKLAADKLVADAKAADVDVAAAKALDDGYKSVTDKAKAALDAIEDFSNANPGVNLANIEAEVVADANGIVKDVFYFADKIVASDDFIIENFAAGDSIVLGNGLTFNSGALSAGNNNALEFFLINSESGVQVVIETAVFGSADIKANATTGIIEASNNAAVITLTGVSADELTVNNGVISHVA